MLLRGACRPGISRRLPMCIGKSRRPIARKLEQMMRYGQSAGCRWMQLVEYFGESLEEPCGTCDNCQHPLEAEIAQPA